MPTPSYLFDPVLGFARSHGGLPVFIAEWGSNTATSTMQPRFIQQMQAYVTANRAIAATMYWDENGGNCHYSIDSHAASVAALRAMGHSAVYQGSAAG